MTSYRDSRIYGIDEICELLRAADRHLTQRASVVIIGGAAAAFHRAKSTTADVDTHETLNAELEEAIERARKETGLVPTLASGIGAEFLWIDAVVEP